MEFNLFNGDSTRSIGTSGDWPDWPVSDRFDRLQWIPWAWEWQRGLHWESWVGLHGGREKLGLCLVCLRACRDRKQSEKAKGRAGPAEPFSRGFQTYWEACQKCGAGLPATSWRVSAQATLAKSCGLAQSLSIAFGHRFTTPSCVRSTPFTTGPGGPLPGKLRKVYEGRYELR